MTRTKLNKLVAILLVMMMTVVFRGYIPQIKVDALNMTYTPTNGFRNSKYYSQLCSVNLTSDQRANLVNVAKSQIGYHEGNNFEQYGGGSSGSDNVTEYNYWYYGQKHAVILQKWLLAEPNTKLADWKAADLCEDDKLDIFDMIEMRKLLIQNNSLSAQ